MNVCVIGTGYVGLVTGTCFAEMGNNVWCVDIDERKINDLKNGIIPIYEPGLEDMVKRNHKLGLLNFTTSLKEGIAEALFAFIAVGTPPGEDGSADLKYVLQVAKDIAESMEKYLVIIDKSTVPVGTAELVRKQVQEVLSKRNIDIKFDIVSNPEFLKEGAAIDDFMKPDRIIIGSDNDKATDLMKELYSTFTRNAHPLIAMDIVSAELTKYAANAMLATRISFMNELAAICEKSGADIEKVRKGIGSDSRIGMPFLYAGLGYGGSCFPKDVKALAKTAKKLGINPILLDSVEAVNNNQKLVIYQKVKDYYAKKNQKLNGKIFAVWGLAFKPNTDDMREAPSIDTIKALIADGASIKCFDPVANENAHNILGDQGIYYFDDHYQMIKDCDALLLLTEWHTFRKPDFNRIKNNLVAPIIFDGRNQYDVNKMNEIGFEYFSIGRNQ